MLIYRRVFDYITSSWVILPFDTDPKRKQYPFTYQMNNLNLPDCIKDINLSPILS